MRYCENCGNELAENAKFCQKCGHPTKLVIDSSSRKEEFVGKIIKCPNCGETLNSFVPVCPLCGYEIRSAKPSNSVREFALKLEAIESRRITEKRKSIFQQIHGNNISETDEQKISLIRSFAIPNTKEDMLEFMIIATSNIDMSSFANGESDYRTASARAVSKAWLSKCEQVYGKASVSLSHDDPCFIKINELYRDTKRTYKKSNNKTMKLMWKVVAIVYGFLFLLLFVTGIVNRIKAPALNKAEDERLTQIFSEIDTELSDGEYKLALINAESIEYNGRDDEAKRRWEVKKEYYIDKIISEARENGIELELKVDQEEESKNESATNETSDN